MHFQEQQMGAYRIYAGALEASRGAEGYLGALVIEERASHQRRPRETFRDDSLACGYRFATPHEALAYALERAQEVLGQRSAA